MLLLFIFLQHVFKQSTTSLENKTKTVTQHMTSFLGISQSRIFWNPHYSIYDLIYKFILESHHLVCSQQLEQMKLRISSFAHTHVTICANGFTILFRVLAGGSVGVKLLYFKKEVQVFLRQISNLTSFKRWWDSLCFCAYCRSAHYCGHTVGLWEFMGMMLRDCLLVEDVSPFVTTTWPSRVFHN